MSREREYTYRSDVRQGSSGELARQAQEWLCLNGFNVVVDGEYGPASAAATRAFQKKRGLPATGTVDRATFAALVAPVRTADRDIAPLPGETLGRLAVRYAKQHAAARPREVGGPNMGPWVRLYMDGNQGSQWAWCAGFATYMLERAARQLGRGSPVKRTYSCDVLASSASSAGCFCPAPAEPARGSQITPGSLFLSRRVAGDWVHVGLVLRAERDFFYTIEGNTNDNGDREGYEVCQRARGYKNMDFVLIQ